MGRIGFDNLDNLAFWCDNLSNRRLKKPGRMLEDDAIKPEIIDNRVTQITELKKNEQAIEVQSKKMFLKKKNTEVDIIESATTQ